MGNLVVKDNVLVEASHKLGEVEQRLILLAILKARKECKTVEQLQGRELIIHADEYADVFGISKDMAYKALKKAVVGLFEAKWGYKYLTNKGEKRVRYERFTQSADYGEGDGIVKFMFSNAIIPMLIELEKRFTVYEIKQVARLSSSYAMRLYEFFMQHFDRNAGKGWLEIPLEDLRFRFGILPTEYKRMCDFKKYVLDRSIKQINTTTDLIAGYKQYKQGRIITGFRFEFKTKSKLDNPKLRENRNYGMMDMMSMLKIEDSKREKENARRAQFSLVWKSLSAQEQEALLDKIEKQNAGNPFEPLFKKSRKEGTVHTNPMFFFWFFEELGI